MLRQERVAQALKKEISIIIHDQLNDPRLGFVTITKVELTPNLRYAKVFFSVLGSEQDHKKTKAALDSALGFIRREVSGVVKLRLAPEITFKEDRSTEYSVRIEELLNEVKQQVNPAVETENKLPERKKNADKRGSRLHKEK